MRHALIIESACGCIYNIEIRFWKYVFQTFAKMNHYNDIRSLLRGRGASIPVCFFIVIKCHFQHCFSYFDMKAYLTMISG